MTYYVIKNDELYHHGVKGMRWGVRNEDRPPSYMITKHQGRPARSPKYANLHTIARFRGSERPHTAEQVVTVTPITGGSSVSEEDKENDALERGKKFVKSLFDKKYELGIGSFSISITKKGKISKAIDAAKNWLKNLFG